MLPVNWDRQNITSIRKVLLRQYKSPASPSKFSRGKTATKTNKRGPKVELNLYYVDTNHGNSSSKNKIFTKGKNGSESMSNVTKVTLNLNNAKTN